MVTVTQILFSVYIYDINLWRNSSPPSLYFSLWSNYLSVTICSVCMASLLFAFFFFCGSLRSRALSVPLSVCYAYAPVRGWVVNIGVLHCVNVLLPGGVLEDQIPTKMPLEGGAGVGMWRYLTAGSVHLTANPDLNFWRDGAQWGDRGIFAPVFCLHIIIICRYIWNWWTKIFRHHLIRYVHKRAL